MRDNATSLISSYIILDELSRPMLHRPHSLCHAASQLSQSIKPLRTIGNETQKQELKWQVGLFSKKTRTTATN